MAGIPSGVLGHPPSTERERFIELGRHFRKIADQLTHCPEQNKRAPLLEEMKRVVRDADDLVQRYGEDFRDWDEE